MKYALIVKERVVLLDLVPKEGNFLFVKMLQELLAELSFSQEESDKLNFRQTTKGEINWDDKAAADIIKEIEIPQTILDQIISALKRLQERSKLTTDHIELYERFLKSE